MARTGQASLRTPMKFNTNIFEVMEKKQRIITFWILTIAGFLSHSMADILPAFWGESIAAMDPPASTGMIALMSCFTYTIPVIGILLTAYGKGRACRTVNAVLACIIAIFCIGHMFELVMEFNPVQLFIMPLMAIIGILMAIDSIKIRKEGN